MRLISLNAWGGKLFDPLSVYLTEAPADVICLQEVTFAGGPSPKRVHFREHGFDLPQQADLFADLQARLPSHQGFFGVAAQGDVVDDAGARHLSRFGIATFVRRDLSVIGQTLDFVHGAFIPHGWGAPPVPRCMHALRLFDPNAGRPFVVGHTHGLRDEAGKHDTPARLAQAERIRAMLDAVRRPDDPVIFGGDLNLLPDSKTFGVLAGMGLADLVTTRGFTDTRTRLYEKPQRYADYLLVTPEVTVVDFDVPAEPVVSDHRALVLNFEL
jgi:endonuclease/exonuclease/phosphatase family metal-dependent hydrolase